MDYIIVIIALLFGFGFKNRFKILNAKDHRILDLLFFYHMLISFVFYLYSSFNPADARMYWSIAKQINWDTLVNLMLSGKSASNSIYFINYIPAKLLDLTYFSGTMLYGVVGYLAIVFLYLSLKKLFPLLSHFNKVKILNLSIFPSILFLPNFHFWSSAIGKDTILFFCISISIYALLTLKRNWTLLILSILLSYLIRPHILLMFVAGFGFAFIIKSKLLHFQKVVIILVGLIFFLPLLSSVLEFANIDDASIESFTEFSDSKSRVLSKGHTDSAIDLGSLPYPLQVLTFLYRPLFFDANGALGLVTSAENLVWLVLSINFFANRPLKTLKNSNLIVLGAFMFWLLGALAFAPSMSNLGIIVRQRNMFLPGFIIFIMAGIAYSPQFQKFRWYFYHKKRAWEEAQNQEQIAETDAP